MQDILTDKELAREFPLTRKFSYFAGASTGIIPERAIAAANGFLQRYRDTNLAFDAEAIKMMGHLRDDIAKLIGASKGEIALVPNTSVGINIIAAGFPWQDGDEVLVGTREFPANTYPWTNLQNRGVNIRWIEMTTGEITSEMVEKALTDRTRLLTISAVQFADGYRADLATIADTCHKRGVKIIVDGIQAVGALRIKSDDWNLDAFSSGGQKHMLSPCGSGFLQIATSLMEKLNPAYDGWLSHFIAAEDFQDLLKHDLPPAPDAQRFEVGTPAYGSLWGMDASVQLLLELGAENIEIHNIGISNIFCEEAKKIPGIEIASDRTEGHKSQIVSIRVPKPQVTHKKLAEQNIIVSLREGCLRFAFHIYNSINQVERAIAVLRKVV